MPRPQLCILTPILPTLLIFCLLYCLLCVYSASYTAYSAYILPPILPTLRIFCLLYCLLCIYTLHPILPALRIFCLLYCLLCLYSASYTAYRAYILHPILPTLLIFCPLYCLLCTPQLFYNSTPSVSCAQCATPWLQCVSTCAQEIESSLLGLQVPINRTNITGATALHLAASNEQNNVVLPNGGILKLVELGAKPLNHELC